MADRSTVIFDLLFFKFTLTFRIDVFLTKLTARNDVKGNNSSNNPLREVLQVPPIAC